MAEDLTKEILPIEEQQQTTKKLWSKNWKLYATALGIITVGLTIGLGVGLGVHNSSQNTVSTTQKIVNEINNIRDYALSTSSDATLESITNQITGDFIKTKLTGDNANQFKTEVFTFNKITVGEDNHELTTSDLTTATTLNAKINYDYGSIANQTTNLTITIIKAIINEINNTTYETNIEINSMVNDFTITPGFIQSKLKSQDKDKFNLSFFTLNKITVGEDNHDLQDSDLTTATRLNAKINYNYDTVINQETNLIITIGTNVWTDNTIISYLPSANNPIRLTYDKATTNLNIIKEQTLNIIINSITSKEKQNYLKEKLMIARLYTSTRVDGQTIQTDVTDERLKNGETTSDYDYLMTRCILSLNGIESKIFTLYLYPNNN